MTATRTSNRPGSLILVVEDEEIIRELLCDVLDGEGFVTEALANADLAKEFLAQRSSDVALLITDINMPGSINGAALANLSRQTWPAIPIVVMSGLESPASSGLSDSVLFIRKPFTVDEIIKCVHCALASAGA